LKLNGDFSPGGELRLIDGALASLGQPINCHVRHPVIVNKRGSNHKHRSKKARSQGVRLEEGIEGFKEEKGEGLLLSALDELGHFVVQRPCLEVAAN